MALTKSSSNKQQQQAPASASRVAPLQNRGRGRTAPASPARAVPALNQREEQARYAASSAPRQAPAPQVGFTQSYRPASPRPTAPQAAPAPTYTPGTYGLTGTAPSMSGNSGWASLLGQLRQTNTPAAPAMREGYAQMGGPINVPTQTAAAVANDPRFQSAAYRSASGAQRSPYAALLLGGRR